MLLIISVEILLNYGPIRGNRASAKRFRNRCNALLDVVRKMMWQCRNRPGEKKSLRRLRAVGRTVRAHKRLKYTSLGLESINSLNTTRLRRAGGPSGYLYSQRGQCLDS